MATRTRFAGLVTAVVGAGVLVLTAAPADAATPADATDPSYTQTATVSSTQSASYTVTRSAPVSETASYGVPPIVQTASDTVSVSDTETSTQTVTVTANGTGSTPAVAALIANLSAGISATIQAQIAAVTQASVNAALAAQTKLTSAIIAKQTDLYNQALAAAKAAVETRSAGAPASTTPDTPVTNCGATIYKADGTAWTCTFDDEFTGTSLDTSKWSAWHDVNWYGDPNMCYDDDANHIAVSGGTLNLILTRNTAGQTCSTPYGTTTPPYLGAVVTTKGNFNQQYGRFEARIEYAGTYGVHSNFWLYSDDNGQPQPAEIDVAEAWGATNGTMIAATHVTGTTGSDAGTSVGCGIPNWSAGFHTYAVEWTPQTVTFIYDDSTCTSWSIPRATFASPATFDQKLFLILQTLADDGTYAPSPNATSVFPATTQVDWVRVWK